MWKVKYQQLVDGCQCPSMVEDLLHEEKLELAMAAWKHANIWNCWLTSPWILGAHLFSSLGDKNIIYALLMWIWYI